MNDERDSGAPESEALRREQAHAQLLKAERRFRQLATEAPVGIFLTDSGGDCVFVNERWRRMTGLASSEALGRGWTLALHPDDRERVLAAWDAASAESGS